MIKKYDPTALNYVQSRAEADFEVIAEYAQMMRDGVEFDPAQGIEAPDGSIFVWDGYHRGQAAIRAGQELAVEIKPGERAEAEWLALGANQKHGLRRSRADRQKAIHLALQHPNGTKLSDREIGRHCGVHHSTVAAVRRELESTGEISQSDVRLGADGREINTARIGERGETERKAKKPQSDDIHHWCRNTKCNPQGSMARSFTVPEKTMTCTKCGIHHIDTFSGIRLDPKDFGHCAVCDTPLTGPGWTWAEDRSKSVCDRCSREHAAAFKRTPEMECQRLQIKLMNDFRNIIRWPTITVEQLEQIDIWVQELEQKVSDPQKVADST